MVFHRLLHSSNDSHPAGVITGAFAYDLLSAIAFAGRRRRFYSRLIAAANITAGDHVLDIGCGPGHLTALAARAATPGGHSCGIDPSEPMIRRARRLRGTDDCGFQLGDAAKLDFDRETIDVIVSSFAFHHIPETARQQSVTEMYRVLRPGGRLLVADFRPPSGGLARHLVGAFAGHSMRDNRAELISAAVTTAGFTSVAAGELRPLTHYVTATKPGNQR